MAAKRAGTRRSRPARNVPVLWSIADWARAVAVLPIEGPLPDATVIVPNERVAHALRRELLRLGRADRLAGTRFVSPFTAARETLEAAGVRFFTGEEALRPLRIRALLRERPALRYFRPERLRDRPGWDEAFARAIDELEGAGWTPADLLEAADPRAADLGLLWQHIDSAAGASWTAARVLREATARLPDAWPLRGPVLAAVTGHESAAQAGFLCALPRLVPAVLAAHPLRDSHLQRLAALFGEPLAAALRAARPPDPGSTARERLAARLFAPAEASGGAARATPLDDTVSLERYAGIEEEIEAAADWVAREVLEHRTPLEEIALLVPSLDPLAGMLVDRLARLPWTDGAFPAHVQGGLPATACAAGVRIAGVLRALADFLPAGRVAEVLPWLRLEDRDGHLSVSEARELAYALGTVGGSIARPHGALDWRRRIEARLAAPGRRSRGDARDAEEEHRRDRTRRERLLRNLIAVRPSLEALADLARRVVDGDPLAELHAPLAEFFDRRVRLPPAAEDFSLSGLLANRVAEACRAADVVAALRGVEAVEFVRATLESLRLGGNRFGDPAVYVGTIVGAAPLPFRAVRILGLAEGHFPSPEQGDPVLDIERRRRLRPGMVDPPDRALTQHHAFDRILRNTTGRLALSSPQTDIHGTEREPSALLIDVASALAPSDRRDERSTAGVVGLDEIDRLWFTPARERRRAWRLAHPLVETAAQDAAAATGATAPAGAGTAVRVAPLRVPPAWLGSPATDLARLLALGAAPAVGPAAGLFPPDAPFPVVPGTTPEAPLSPTALRALLECPHRFLIENLLGWEGPSAPPTGLDLDPLTFGSLVHRVAERFSRRHGADFGRRRRDLEHWKAVAGALAREEFDSLLEEYPLAGPDVRAQQLRRLLSTVVSFVQYDWNEGEPRTFFDVERRFGDPGPDGRTAPFELRAGEHALYVHGRIDRIDIEGRTTLLRDFKTGTAHPRTQREAGPLPKLDVQLALYGLVAEGLAEAWGLPRRVEVAYAYVERHPARERAFREDWAELREAALRWLGLASRLLAGRAFPRTPLADDCTYCPFAAVCGEAAPGGGMAAEPPAGTAAADYVALRLEEG